MTTKKEMLGLLDNLKGKIADDIRKLIEAMPDEPEVWKPEEIKWENYFIMSPDGSISRVDYSKECYLKTGFCRPNGVDSRHFFDKTVMPMFLIALRAYQIDPEWKADWKNPSQSKWTLFYDHQHCAWNLDLHQIFQFPGQPYMAGSTARQIRDELNSGFLKVGIGEKK